MQNGQNMQNMQDKSCAPTKSYKTEKDYREDNRRGDSIDMSEVLSALRTISRNIVQGQNEIVSALQALVAATTIVELKYDSGTLTLANAVAAEPDTDNVSATGYVRVGIYDTLERISPVLYLINNGPGIIYARMSKNGQEFSFESPINEGEVKTYYNVYEIRLRSPTANTNYIVTEYEYYKQRNFEYLSGRPYVSEDIVVVVGTPNTENIVTDAVQGLGRNAHTGYIVNDGPGNLEIGLSNDGVTYTPDITIIPNQILDLNGEDIYSITIDTTIINTNYRLVVH